jgi:uncharacterized protein (TIGR02217 family)
MAVNLTTLPLDTSSLTSRIRYSTDIIVGKSGREVRNANWQDPLYAYNVGSILRTKADVEILQAFFHIVKGRETAFLIKDYQDFAVDTFTPFAETVDGTRNTFQLIKVYTDALSNTYTRTITKPVSGTTQPRVAGTPLLSGFAVDLNTGIVGFDTPPTAASVVDFKVEFYVPVRFDIDELPTDMILYDTDDHTLVNIPEIPLVEVRV